MTNSEILKYIEAPELLVDSNIDRLEELVTDYPFFQSAHILFLKALKSQKKTDFEQILSKSSVYISDRDLLFKFLNKEYENIDVKEEVVEKEKKKVESRDDFKILKNKDLKRKINDSFEGMGENISETISSQLEFSVVKDDSKLEYPSEIYFIEEERDGTNNIITIDADPDDIKKIKKKKDILQIDEIKTVKPEDNSLKNQNAEESFLLIESRGNGNNFPEEKQKDTEYFDINNYADKDVLDEGDSLIDRFIQKNPRLKPIEVTEENIDISEESAKENSNLLSETLAKVYIKQGLFEKAIQSYKKLSLKYPEKSTYFASQIEILQEKINKQ